MAWRTWHFPLSEDLPLRAGQTFSAGERNSAPGAIDDARPDRWGERIIRHIDQPRRLSILEMLLFAGDDRFGALGVSVSAQQYIPRRLGPYPTLRDLAPRSRAVEDVQTQAPLSPEIQRLVQPAVGLGAARPKALPRQVAEVVAQWPEFFRQQGVSPADMELLAASIDREALKTQRQAYL